MNHYNVAFISLGCDKNRINCEQMMYLTQAAGHLLLPTPEGADVCVINTCGFIDAAKEEAIGQILQVAQLKEAGQVKKILVSGCLAQRYREEIKESLPEVDGILGTGNYTDIVQAIEEVMADRTPEFYGDIDHTNEGGQRLLSTPDYLAYLKIAEGCSNHCAFCVIPKLRGKYRSRPAEDILQEAHTLSENGVKELIIIAQDITRYGMDLYGARRLPELLRQLCKMNFHWIRLHYMYPDQLTDELIDTIASEEKILPYFDIPLQHCSDRILTAMCRRGSKAEIVALLDKIRAKIPNAVFRTSLITGLPGEGEQEFAELCSFLKEYKLERVGAFAFSPEEGTRAAEMEYPDSEIAQQRAEQVAEIQSRIMDDYNESCIGKTMQVLCEGFDPDEESYYGRTYADSPDIDGKIWFTAERHIKTGDFVDVRVVDTYDGELVSILEEDYHDDSK